MREPSGVDLNETLASELCFEEYPGSVAEPMRHHDDAFFTHWLGEDGAGKGFRKTDAEDVELEIKESKKLR